MKLKAKVKKRPETANEEPSSPFDQDSKSNSIRGLLAILFASAYFYRTGKIDSEVVNSVPRWAEDANGAIIVDGLPIQISHLESLLMGLLHNDVNKTFAVMRQVGQAILQIDKNARHNLEFSRKDMDLLSSIGAYFRNNESESAWNRVFRSIDLLGIPVLSAQFTPDNVDPQKILSIKKRMRSLTRKLLDDPETKSYMLTFQQATQFTKEHKKRALYEKYMVAQRELRAEWNNAALTILRRTNKPMLVSEFEARMKQAGVIVRYIPFGFNAKIGLNGKKIELFTLDDKPIAGWPLRGRKVKMNPRYGKPGANQYVFKAIDEETGKENQYYTHDHHKTSRVEKFKMVDTVLSDIESYKTRWEEPLKKWLPNSKITLEVIQSAQAYFMYETQARIGGKGNKTGDKDTFGVTTWKVGHVRKIESGLLRISYSGKKAVKQTHQIVAKNALDKKVIHLVKMLMANRQKKDMLWMVPGIAATKSHASAALFRKWLKSIGFPATPHKLRHAKGTKIAKEIMASVEFKPDTTKSKDIQAKQAADFFKEKIAKKVAQALGHKNADGSELIMTSVKSYIDPSVSKKWFVDNGFRPPSWIPASDG